MNVKDLKEVICFLPILVLVGIKLFVFPTLFVCMLAFFFFASAWTDAAAAPAQLVAARHAALAQLGWWMAEDK